MCCFGMAQARALGSVMSGRAREGEGRVPSGGRLGGDHMGQLHARSAPEVHLECIPGETRWAQRRCRPSAVRDKTNIIRKLTFSAFH